MDNPVLRVCTNQRLGEVPSCAGNGSRRLIAALRREISARQLDWIVAESVCLGHCRVGPNLKAVPGGPLLNGCRPEGVAALIDGLLETWPAVRPLRPPE